MYSDGATTTTEIKSIIPLFKTNVISWSLWGFNLEQWQAIGHQQTKYSQILMKTCLVNHVILLIVIQIVLPPQIMKRLQDMI